MAQALARADLNKPEFPFYLSSHSTIRAHAWGEKDGLENELHRLVCSGKMSLADAQRCITSNWVQCWDKYVVPGYGPEWAAAYRHGW
jgi:hypothetical protein